MVNKVKEKILDEMCQLLDKQPMTKDDISILGELADALKDVTTATGMDMYGEKYLTPNMSHMRGHSPSTGGFVSRDEMPYMSKPMYATGYSGHSVNDKMIASLEHLMNQAEGDYEKQQIYDEIQSLRTRM